jgi:hypothetical protein
MPLTDRERDVAFERFGGQRGREPLGQIDTSGGAISEGTLHDSAFLTRGDGSVKLVSAPFPQSGYELRGVKTGILELPIPDAYIGAFNTAIGAADKAWGVSLILRPLELGAVPDGATDDGQLLISTATQIGTHPDGGGDINSVRLGIVLAAGVYKLRMKWGITTTDISLAALDLTRHLFISLHAFRGVAGNTVEFRAFDGLVSSSIGSVFEAKEYVVHRIHVGGEMPERRPFFGIHRPCPCVVSQAIVYANLAAVTVPSVDIGDDAMSIRVESGVQTATEYYDAWLMNESGSDLESILGNTARIVGNRVHRGEGVTAEQGGGLYFDGTGALLLPRAARTRKATATVAGHYLEHDEWSYVTWLDPQRTPWRGVSVERACFVCWATPMAANLGVAADPETYPDTLRPSEHLRLEIRRDSTNWYIYGFFGDIEPVSLTHPAGTRFGSTSTSWPPSLAAGVPPCTWNKPHDDPTVGHAAADGKAAFRVLIGADADPTHPMAYRWLVFAQRKFVAQGSGSNACAVFVRRYSAAGALDTGFGEVDDANADASGERHPANQSCFSVARLNGNDLSLRPEAYVFAIGAGIGSRFGDEEMDYDGTTRAPMVYPMDDDLVPFTLSDECEAFPYLGGMSQPTLLSKWLTARDRQMIAEAGAFGGGVLDQFRDSILFSLACEEDGGTILRDARGNDVAYSDKVGVVAVDANVMIDKPGLIGLFPRPEPSWHNEAAPYVNEYGRINGIAQRIGASGDEELYAIGLAGLYAFSRATHDFTRVGSLPGQGGPGQASVTVDSADVIHIAGGTGRPVMITRERAIAVSGVDRPIYPVPGEIITANKTLPGGITIEFQYMVNTNPLMFAGFEIDDAAIMQFAIGFWSDLLRTRSRPGGRITVQFTAPGGVTTIVGAGARAKYRVAVGGLPLPQGPSANLVTHWELYRTDSNGRILHLEKRVPIADAAAKVVVGDILTLGEEADYLRDVPPEGMRTICAYDRRLIGASTAEFPRSVWYTKLDDSGAWPPIYRRTLTQTPSPARGVVVRRDRAFAFSDDHMYQILDGRIDADLGQGIVESVDISPTVRGCGALSQMAVIDDDQNGVYMPGGKTVHLTEGGTYYSVSQPNDAADAGVDDERWLWPTSWNLEDGHEFVGFHDERRRMVALCGPSSDDPDRRDLMQLFYEKAIIADDGRQIPIGMEMSRVRGVDMTCAASVINPETKQRETWFGTSRGYLCKFGGSTALGVDYSWLDPVAPRCGEVLAIISTTGLRIEGSYGDYPAADLFRGALLRLMRDGEQFLETRIEEVEVSPSWVDLTLGVAHGALPGDMWTIGSIKMLWKSGLLDGGTLLQDKAFQAADLLMNQ